LNQGADEFIDYQVQQFERTVRPVDLVIEAVKDDTNVLRSLETVVKGGSLISLWSSIDDHISAYAKSLGVNAFYNMVVSNGADMEFITNLLHIGALKPHVSATYPLSQVGLAHQHLEKNKTQGKIVLVP
jgi:NADPH:quinone reductase-like Zn-dependent oxidoreductase